jgi:TRAP-type C4-dicarboxylate transport system permease small subunit
MEYLIKFNSYLNKVLLFFSGISVLILTGIAAANMFLRIVYSPIPGSYELVGFFGAVATGLALGYTQIRKDHIIVTMFTDKFPRTVNKILDGLNYTVNTIFFAIISWETYKWGMKIARTGEVSETLKVIYHPFVFCLAIGFAALSFSIFVDFVKLLKREASA